jgi:hypothetical protein
MPELKARLGGSRSWLLCYRTLPGSRNIAERAIGEEKA